VKEFRKLVYFAEAMNKIQVFPKHCVHFHIKLVAILFLAGWT